MFFDKVLESTTPVVEESHAGYYGISSTSPYMMASAYEEYIDNKIKNESALLAMIESKITGKSESAILLEGKLGDSVKAKWNKLIAFIKEMIGKFMESINNILLSNKSYLEKYKEIILRRKPKEGMKFSYTGDYEVGIKRLINTTFGIRVEDLLNASEKSSEENKDKSNEDLEYEFFNGIAGDKAYKYDRGKTLAENFKEYFIATDRGESSGGFDKLNMTNLYNFCYNHDWVKKITDKDLADFEKFVKILQDKVDQSIKAHTDPNKQPNTTAKAESAYVLEEENSNEKKDNSTNTNAPKQISSFSNEDKDNIDKIQKLKITDNIPDDQKIDSATANDKSAAVRKEFDMLLTFGRTMIAAKLTVAQQIARDYMGIIRAHVRSYGGKDDPKDTNSKTSAKQGDNYQKDSEKNK